ncbi:MAG: UDP-N-acetylmuramoylalanyl-D-glutamate--2,6-diaminopimelate ligase, partial [Acidiphilium sp. 37-67-22]
MSALWSARDLAAATNGTWLRGEADATGVSIDSRTIARGALFVALADVRDGHDFVPDAEARGASCVLVSRDVGTGPALLVEDVQAALTA